MILTDDQFTVWIVIAIEDLKKKVLSIESFQEMGDFEKFLMKLKLWFTLSLGSN